MYSIKSWLLWCALPTAVIVSPIIWSAHTISVEQNRATAVCATLNMSPIVDPQGRVVCAVIARP